VQLETVSQSLQVPDDYITRAQAATPADYEHKDLGLAVSPGYAERETETETETERKEGSSFSQD
jgi:hypothetical protein